MKGVVSFSADPDTRITIDDAWAREVRAMGFDWVRTPMPTSTQGIFPNDIYQKAFECYRKAGLGVRVVLNPGFLYTLLPASGAAPLFPNFRRNSSGDQLSSPWINLWSLRAAAVLRQLSQVEVVYVWNEPNLLGMLTAGGPVPPGTKGSALAPDVFAALCWQSAKRIKAYRRDIKVFCGGLSLLPQTGLDPRNPYLAQYLEAFYQTFSPFYHLAHPWPWDGLALNMEGWWTMQHAADAIGCVRNVMARHGDTGVLTIGEWGVNNAGLDAAKAQETFTALTTVLGDEGAFFQDPALTPSFDLNNYGDYGLRLWRQDNQTATFEALGSLPWRAALAPLLGGT